MGKKGVVHEASTHREVIVNAIGFAKQSGFIPAGLSFSPIKGPEGNIEFLLYVTKNPADPEVGEAQIDDIVAKAHGALDEAKAQKNEIEN